MTHFQVPQHLKILTRQEEAFIGGGSMAALRIHKTPDIASYILITKIDIQFIREKNNALMSDLYCTHISKIKPKLN